MILIDTMKSAAPEGYAFTKAWIYHDAAGDGIGAVARYDAKTANGSRAKTFFPFIAIGDTLVCRGFPRPRPLYGLDLPAKHPDAPVLVCEGEKAADAAGKIFQNHVCVTSPGGAQGAAHADWAPLEGRDVTIWPDNDGPGAKYASQVQECVPHARIVRVPESYGAGWDLADTMPAGVTDLELAGLVAAAASTKNTHGMDALAEASRKAVPGTWKPVVRCAADIEPEAVLWLWNGRLARGKHTCIAGEPGTGKSQASISIIAAVTTAGAWPCGEGAAPSCGNVIILSAEDGEADTIVPRLVAAGADLKKVHLFSALRKEDGAGSRSFDLQQDLHHLERQIEIIGAVGLIVIDPISSYLGRVDSHKNAEVRGVLEPIGELAERLAWPCCR